MELNELKELNAKEEADKAEAERLAAMSTEDTDPGDETDQEETDTSWMREAEGEQTPEEDLSSSVPVGKHVSLKKKLKGEISERDTEIEKLKKELEALKNPVKEISSVLVRPKEIDFDTDEEYELALSKYDEARLQEIYNRNRKKEQQTEAQKQAQAAIEQAMDQHYERAEELVKKSGIAQEKYVSAAKNAKGVFAEIFGAESDMVYNAILAKLGKGSEKLEYFIGVNRAAQDKIRTLLKDDPNGISLAIWLGQEKQRLTNPIKPRSNAPDPAKSVNGEVSASLTGLAKKLKKKYDESGPGTQDAYNAKKEAKKSGIDVSKW